MLAPVDSDSVIQIPNQIVFDFSIISADLNTSFRLFLNDFIGNWSDIYLANFSNGSGDYIPINNDCEGRCTNIEFDFRRV